MWFFQNLQFIRCILPNNAKQHANFDEELVLRQLLISCTVSYAKFIRFGYSKRVSHSRIIDACKWNELKIPYISRSKFCVNVLLCIGFKLNDFKMGNEAIAFRSNKFHLLEKFFSDCDAVREEEKEILENKELSLAPNQKHTPK